MRMLDLFSGIGGFSLAASWAGIETVAFCEKEPFCQNVLHKHWPEVPIVNDIYELRGDEFGAIDIISGGFPCQPFSFAGKREGKEDDRHLWPEMLRVIETAKPTWVLGENVAGIISLALDDVLSDLERIGYSTQAFVIPACAVDAPHRRDRVWIVAHAENGRLRRRGSQRKAGQSSFGCKDVANPRSARRKRRRKLKKEWTPDSFKRCNSSDGIWISEPNVGRVASRVSNRVDRLKSLGNAIVPQVAFKFFEAMVEIDEQGR